ncbi:MFS transporter [Mariniluteicoccus flavus]
MTTAPAAVRSLGHHRNFRLLWFGEGISVLGSMTSTVVLPLLAVDRFHATAWEMGLLAAATWAPWLVFGLIAGALVDRLDNRRVMIAADLVAAAAFASVPVAAAFGSLSLIQLLVVALVAGTCTVFFRTAYAGLIPQVVADDQLDAANGRLVGTESAMHVAGPGLGGVLVGFVGAVGAVVVDALSFLVSAVCLWRIRRDGPRRDEDPAEKPSSAQRPSVRAIPVEIREGVSVTVRDPFMRFFALVGGLSNLGLTGYQSLLVLFMVRELNLGPVAIGQLMAIGSAGGVIGAVLAPHVARRVGTARAVILLLVPTGPAALLVAFATPEWGAWPVAVGPLLVGVGVVGANTIRTAWRQRYTPPELLGRTIGATSVVNFGLMPVGALAAGWLGSTLSVRTAILVMALVHLLSAASHFVSPLRTLRDLPTRMPTEVDSARG